MVYSWKPHHIEPLRRTPNGSHLLRLVHENGNTADRNAVQLWNENGPIGYLAPEDASRYVRLLQRIPDPLYAMVHITGEDDSRRVWVELASTRRLNAWLASEHDM